MTVRASLNHAHYFLRHSGVLLTVKSTRFGGRSSGLDAGFVSTGVWFVVAGTG